MLASSHMWSTHMIFPLINTANVDTQQCPLDYPHTFADKTRCCKKPLRSGCTTEEELLQHDDPVECCATDDTYKFCELHCESSEITP